MREKARDRDRKIDGETWKGGGRMRRRRECKGVGSKRQIEGVK